MLGLSAATFGVSNCALAEDARLVLGASYGTPLRTSGTVGILLGEECADCIDAVHEARLVRLAAGQGGMKVSYGIGGGMFGSPLANFGAAVSAVCIRTWGTPAVARPRETYLGVDLEFGLICRVAGGGAVRISDLGKVRWLWTWSAGLGF